VKDLARITSGMPVSCETRVSAAPRQILHGLKAIQDDAIKNYEVR
jgi:hypothetical protein